MLSVVLAWPVLRPLQLDAKFSVSELECTSFWHCKSLLARCPKCTKNHLVARRSSAQTFPGSTRPELNGGQKYDGIVFFTLFTCGFEGVWPFFRCTEGLGYSKSVIRLRSLKFRNLDAQQSLVGT